MNIYSLHNDAVKQYGRNLTIENQIHNKVKQYNKKKITY